jgi:hypothetical protein
MKIRIIIPVLLITLAVPGVLSAQEDTRTQIHIGLWWTSPD